LNQALEDPPKEEKKEEKPPDKKEEKPPEPEKKEAVVAKVKKATDIFDGICSEDTDNSDTSSDPYYDVDFKSVKLGDIDKEFASMAEEEKDAFMTPLNKKELRKMESTSKSLMGEITTGLDTYGKNKFWRQKKFFRDHIGF